MKCYDIDQMRRDMGLPDCIRDRISDIKYKDHKKGDRFCLLTDKKYALFFLLEGRICVQSDSYERKVIRQGHFFFLNYPYGFSYEAEENTRCIILSFSDFRHPGNILFFAEADLMNAHSADNFFPLPIKEPLYHTVNSMLVYMSDGFDYPNIHEALFVLIRALYSPMDVTIMFQHIIRRLAGKESSRKKEKWHV